MEVRTIIGADPYTYEDYINAINLNEEFDANMTPLYSMVADMNGNYMGQKSNRTLEKL